MPTKGLCWGDNIENSSGFYIGQPLENPLLNPVTISYSMLVLVYRVLNLQSQGDRSWPRRGMYGPIHCVIYIYIYVGFGV